MKIKFLPLALAAVCALLPAVSCAKSADEAAAPVYCKATASPIESAAESESETEAPAEELPLEEITTEAAPAESANDTADEDFSAEEQADEPTDSPTDSTTEESAGEPIYSAAESLSVRQTSADNEAEETEEESGLNEAEKVEEIAEEEQGEAAEATAVYIKCICTDLNIRSGAGTEYSSLGKAEKGTLFAYLGTENGWHKTYYKGEYAYVSAYSGYTALVEIERGDEKTENVISEGLKLIGTKYVYGAVRLHDGNGNLLSGFTADEFDCSSLIQYIFYYGAGVILDVNTRTQYYQGQYVHPYSLQRGDCIYFTNSSRCNNSGVERVGHVALYLGDGYILHTASDYCKIEKISEARWNYYVEARRFI